jgi:predicted acyl esterase
VKLSQLEPQVVTSSSPTTSNITEARHRWEALEVWPHQCSTRTWLLKSSRSNLLTSTKSISRVAIRISCCSKWTKICLTWKE